MLTPHKMLAENRVPARFVYLAVTIQIIMSDITAKMLFNDLLECCKLQRIPINFSTRSGRF